MQNTGWRHIHQRSEVLDIRINLQLPTIEMPTVREDNFKKEAQQLDLRNVDFSDIKELINSAKFSDN
ncbi:unnamed protein product [Parnassius apollo]|uniref:(apollo) hypothetical protein n=1 Tax=Parnassius apollo TaxID=110799 RepID=A0A8S3XHQ0_PARAO|nr:unnamed protein product [Parnassius apollo]